MVRRDKILKHIHKDGKGIEIGASYNPVAAKKNGFNVHVIDCKNREDLIKKYSDSDVNLDNIEEVDFIWNGEPYSELTGKKNHYDWIIASHLIEHTPDLIGFLIECDDILKNDGVVSLVVPDKRFCFDHFRPITGISKIIDSHIQGNKNHTLGTIAEIYLNLVNKEGEAAWRANTKGKYTFEHSVKQAREAINGALSEKEYMDAHSWCFVPHSFRLLIHDLYHLGYISFQEVDFYPTYGSEFYITLSRKGKGSHLSRMEMLEVIKLELSETDSSSVDQSLLNLYEKLKALKCSSVNIYGAGIFGKNLIEMINTENEISINHVYDKKAETLDIEVNGFKVLSPDLIKEIGNSKGDNVLVIASEEFQEDMKSYAKNILNKKNCVEIVCV